MLNTENCLLFNLKAWIEFCKININLVEYLLVARNCVEYFTDVISLYPHDTYRVGIIVFNL